MKVSELRIVFVGGIHGVGKSHFSSRVSRLLGVPALTAGNLIAQQQKRAIATEKRVRDVDRNQDALVAALEAYPTVNGSFILDGHFCVIDSVDKIQKIPVETFQKLSPVAVVVLADDVREIQKRLEIRDKRIFKTKVLDSLQRAELEHARKISAQQRRHTALTGVSPSASRSIPMICSSLNLLFLIVLLPFLFAAELSFCHVQFFGVRSISLPFSTTSSVVHVFAKLLR